MAHHLTRLAALVALALVVACTSDAGSQTPGPTIDDGTTAPSAAPTAPITPIDQIPAEFTVDYVQRVMDAHDQAWGDMFRQYRADNGPTPDNLAWLEELYTGSALDRFKHDFSAIAGSKFEQIRDDPGNPTTTVESIEFASPDCLAFKGVRTYGAVFDEDIPVDDAPSYFEMAPYDSDNSRNPTAWRISRAILEEFNPDPDARCQ